MIGPSNSLEVAESHPRSKAPSGLHRRGNQRPLSHRQPVAFQRGARHKSAAEAGKEGAKARRPPAGGHPQEATRLGKEAFRTLKPQREAPEQEAPAHSATQEE